MLAALLGNVARGCRHSFDRLDRLARPVLARHARRTFHQRHDADEIVQAAFIAIWRAAGTYDPALAAPMTWMVSIVRNLAIDRWRRDTAARRCDEALIVDDWQPPTSRSPCDLLEIEQELAAVLARVKRLAPDQRDAVTWTWLHGLTQSEAASRMDKPLGTVKTLVRRGMLSLRACAG